MKQTIKNSSHLRLVVSNSQPIIENKDISNVLECKDSPYSIEERIENCTAELEQITDKAIEIVQKIQNNEIMKMYNQKDTDID